MKALVLIIVILRIGSGLFAQTPHIENTPDLEILAVLEHRAPSTEFGTHTCGIGDINQDGYDDFVVGALEDSVTHIRRAYIYYGGNPPDTIPDRVLRQGYPNAGFEISTVGDVNGDGYGDFIIGEPGWAPVDTFAYNPGRAKLYFGGAAFDTIPDMIFRGPDNSNAFGGLGKRLSHGDVNGDGFDDVLISDYIFGRPSVGKVYLYFGGPLLDSIPDWTKVGWSTWRDSMMWFGYKSALADVNSDGYSDILITGLHASHPPDSTYLAIFLGGTTPDTLPDYEFTFSRYGSPAFASLVAQDYNADGVGDFTVQKYHTDLYLGGAPLDTVPDVIFDPGALHINRLWENAGDVNGDGYPDILVSSPVDNRVGLYLGGNPMNGTLDWIAEGYHLGNAISGAGDVNGDGYDDFLVSALLEYGTSLDFGRVFVIAGSPALKDLGTAVSPEGTEIPTHLELQPAYPNPFNAQTIISFTLPTQQKITLRILDLQGHEIATLVHGMRSPGEYRMVWDGRETDSAPVASGLYFAVLQTSTAYQVRKLVLLK